MKELRALAPGLPTIFQDREDSRGRRACELLALPTRHLVEMRQLSWLERTTSR
jgi:hypothetical protein